MKTKKLLNTRSGEVKTVNAVAAIHKILEEMSPDGTLDCQMQSSKTEARFIFISGGVCATFHLQASDSLKS